MEDRFARRSNYCPNPRAYRLATERRYDEIPSHVKTYPQDILWEDQYGSTVLHILCRAPRMSDVFLRAVASILEQEPQLCGKRNRETMTPLYLACEKTLLWRQDVPTERLILMLIEAFPEAVTIKSGHGYNAKTPFHICCENDVSNNVLQAMLRINPELAAQPAIEREAYTICENPLQILWKKQIRKETPDMSRMETLLRAAYSGSVEPDPHFRVICAACSVRCPRDYVIRLLSLHYDQISEPDHVGYLPLHYAVQSAMLDSQLYTDFLIEWLLKNHPEAASVPFGNKHDGKVLPLHYLIADRHLTWHKGGIRHLVFANPDALRVPDPRSRLVPFLASAEHATHSRLHLSTTYELLRAAPDVIQ